MLSICGKHLPPCFLFCFFRGKGKDILVFIEANLMNKTVLYVKVYNVQIWCASHIVKRLAPSR